MMLYSNFRWGFSGERQEMEVVDGRVTARFPSTAIRGEDLGGRYLLPAFIDSHCHILPTGLDLQKLYLGACSNEEEVLDAVRQRLPEVPEGKWLLAVHYDQTKFASGEHMTRDQLDAISTAVPILLRHVNGHASVANTAALVVAGVADDTPDPDGGTFRRDAAGRLDGVLLEHAHEIVSHASPMPTLEEMVDAILRAGESMAAFGIGCASDMMTGRYDLAQELEAYILAAERGCKVRTRLYVQWSSVFGPHGCGGDWLRQQMIEVNPDRCRIGGIKIFADGAIGSATAGIYGSYSGVQSGGPTISRRAKSAAAGAPEGVEVSGQLIYSPERLRKMVTTAHEGGFQVAIHTIGDYSTDLVMKAYEALGDARRHRIEHAMILSDAQIDRMARLGCRCTFQPEFMVRFGHSYLRQLGPERTSHLKRARSVLDAGIPLSFSSDRPIVAGDPWDGILTACMRPAGFDPAEAVKRQEAVLAYTTAGGHANEDDSMGSLEVGHLADFQLYDEDPMLSKRPRSSGLLG